MENVLILGSGPAGYTAAIYAARAGLKPLLVSGPQVGGQLMTTTDVENYPGFERGCNGFELMQAMQAQAARFGTRFQEGMVTGLELAGRVKTAFLEDGTRIATRSLIVATGASAKWLGIPGEDEYKGRGVSACATCDGFFFKGKDVVVIGGGDTACEEALYLANLCKYVIMLVRKDTLRASQIMQRRVYAHSRILVRHGAEPLRFTGDGERLTQIWLRDSKTNHESSLYAEGAFVAIGHTPNTQFLKGQVDMDAHGYLKTDPTHFGCSALTSKAYHHAPVPGVFVAGDCADHVYRQAVTAAGEGCKAALQAERYLASLPAYLGEAKIET